MTRHAAAVALTCALATLPLHGQTPTFEIASIKRNVSSSPNSGIGSQGGGRVNVTNMTLRNIVRGSRRLQEYEVVSGGADWITNDRWDIVAKAADNVPVEQLALMLQNLLTERFKLVTHRETREMPIYALMLARPDRTLGAAMQASSLNCTAVRDACGVSASPGRFKGTGRTMADLARNLSPAVGRMIVNKTDLAGQFDLEMTWNDTEGPSLFTAMQEQLGLKLDPQRGPVDVLVIDSAARPMED